MTIPVPGAGSNESRLVRGIGVWALAASILNVTIGGSIFALPGTLAGYLDASAPLVFILGACLFIPITLCFAAAGSRVTHTGGPYSYVAAAFGRLPGFVVGALLWISSIAGSAGLAAILADQAARILPGVASPGPRSLLLFGIYAFLVLANARGVKMGIALIVTFAAAKVLPLLALVAAGVYFVHPTNLLVTELPSWHAIGKSLVLVIFAYSGIETAIAPSGEVRNASSTVPKAALAGVGVVIALYVSVQCVTQGVLGADLPRETSPLMAMADRIVPGSGRWVVLTATVSLCGCIQGDLLGSSRLLYALARDRFLPHRMASVTQRTRVPLLALICHGVAAWLAACGGTFSALALISGGAFCLVYIATCAAAWRLQAHAVMHSTKPWRLPGGPLLPLLGIVGLGGILCTLERHEWIAIGGALAVIALVYGINRWFARRSQSER